MMQVPEKMSGSVYAGVREILHWLVSPVIVSSTILPFCSFFTIKKNKWI